MGRILGMSRPQRGRPIAQVIVRCNVLLPDRLGESTAVEEVLAARWQAMAAASPTSPRCQHAATVAHDQRPYHRRTRCGVVVLPRPRRCRVCGGLVDPLVAPQRSAGVGRATRGARVCLTNHTSQMTRAAMTTRAR